jgi:hypothetical protein
MNQVWTIKRVKEELPEVKVKLPGGRVVAGYVKGRTLDFAKVYFDYCGLQISKEYAWEAVVKALNEDSPLSI